MRNKAVPLVVWLGWMTSAAVVSAQQPPTATLPPAAPTTAPPATPPGAPAAPPATAPPATAPPATPAPAPPPAQGTAPPPLPTGPAKAPLETGVTQSDPPAPTSPPPPLEGAPPPAPITLVRPEEPPIVAVPAPDPSAQRHDGFYLRMGLGVGYVGARVDTGLGELGAARLGPATEFAIGGTVADGLVVGGAFYFTSFADVKWTGDGLRDLYDDDDLTGGDGSIGVLGIFVDWYPNPREGFHVQGALGLGALAFEEDSSGLPPEDWSGAGGGLMLGAGYEFWVGKQWSLGGVARVVLVSGTLQDGDRDVDMDAKGFAPALLFGATYH